jgi:hypothetical protein
MLTKRKQFLVYEDSQSSIHRSTLRMSPCGAQMQLLAAICLQADTCMHPDCSFLPTCDSLKYKIYHVDKQIHTIRSWIWIWYWKQFYVDYKLQNMEGLFFNYLSFEYRLVLIYYILVLFTSYTGDVNKQSLYDFCYSIERMYVNVDTSLSVLLFFCTGFTKKLVIQTKLLPTFEY